jgi:hypothetical protein
LVKSHLNHPRSVSPWIREMIFRMITPDYAKAAFSVNRTTVAASGRAQEFPASRAAQAGKYG